MPAFKLAHVRQQGVDLIIIPLNPTFGAKPAASQQQVISQLQGRANSAGLKGTVVPVWSHIGGKMAFVAPPSWHPFFKSIGLPWVAANINRELRW